MINIQRFVCNMLQENCYVVSDETRDCVIIDCGAFYPEERQAIVQYIRDNQLKPKHLLGTHGHLDHHFGNDTIYKQFGLHPEVHIGDEAFMRTLAEQATTMFGLQLEAEMPPVIHYLSASETITFGNHQFSIIETPGHSRGGVFFYCEAENVAFSGDTLFRNSIGRTDLSGGSMFMIIQSLRHICQLPDQTVILPGHGEQTTIGHELASNPYLDR